MNQLQVRPQTQVQVTIKDQIASALEFAQFLFKAGMAPESFKTPEAMAVTMMRGAELGFTYSESVTSLYPVRNAVGYYAKAMVYMFEHHGGKVELLEWDADHAKIRLSQRGRASLIVQFTLAECKAAGWNMQGGSEKETWKKMPRIMVLNRTVTNGIRAYSPASQFVRTFDPDMADQVDEDAEADDDTIDGAVTELMVGAQVEPEPPSVIVAMAEVAQAVAQEAATRIKTWTSNKAKVDELKLWIADHGLTNQEALKAAGIAKLSEYAGSYNDFIDLLTEYTSEGISEL